MAQANLPVYLYNNPGQKKVTRNLHKVSLLFCPSTIYNVLDTRFWTHDLRKKLEIKSATIILENMTVALINASIY